MNLKELEANIITAGRQLDFDYKNIEKFVESPEFDAYLKAWIALLRYYRAFPESMYIHLELVGDFIDVSRFLRRGIIYAVEDNKPKTALEAGLDSLENILSEILSNVIGYDESK